MERNKLIITKCGTEHTKKPAMIQLLWISTSKLCRILCSKKTIYVLPFVLFVVIGSSFNSSDLQPDISCQIDAINSSYSILQPDTGKKIEPIYTGDSTKIEVPIQLIQGINDEINNSYSKTKVLNLKSEPIYGVLKDYNCGPYNELVIYMDCEDTNPQSKSFGWTGSSVVVDPTSKRNVMLKFCVVNGGATLIFQRTNVDYAVLALGLSVPSEASIVKRIFTNEYDNNKNWAMEIQQSNQQNVYVNWYGDCEFYNSSMPEWYSISNNLKYYRTHLFFYYFPKVTIGSIEFPNILNGNYGVFGRFGPKQGYIYTDDEDTDYNFGFIEDENKRNHNSLWPTPVTPGFEGLNSCIEEVGQNTRLYISKVQSYCSYP